MWFCAMCVTRREVSVRTQISEKKNTNAELRGAYKRKPVEYTAAETAASANDKCQRLLGVGQERETNSVDQTT